MLTVLLRFTISDYLFWYLPTFLSTHNLDNVFDDMICVLNRPAYQLLICLLNCQRIVIAKTQISNYVYTTRKLEV